MNLRRNVVEKENNPCYHVNFTEEFDLCLNSIETFFEMHGQDTLHW